MGDSALKPCPFCGGAEFEFGRDCEDREGTPKWVICWDCGARGPVEYCHEGNQLAADAWNKRVTQERGFDKIIDALPKRRQG